MQGKNIIKAKITEKVTIRIGPMVQKCDVFIGKIADSSSLCQDFLKFHSSIIDMEKKTLTLNQSIIPITKIKTREKLWVKLTKDTPAIHI